RTLLAAIGAELAALGERDRELARGAAVSGDPFDLELAAAAAAQDPAHASLDRLVGAGLIRPAGAAGFEFRHALVRRAVYDGAGPAWRLAAHERVAAELARRGASAAARGHHVARYAKAGDEQAIAVLTQAARSAVDVAPASAAH